MRHFTYATVSWLVVAFSGTVLSAAVPAQVNEAWRKEYRQSALPNVEERALALAFDSKGDIYLTGTSGKELLTMKLRPDGSQIWSVRNSFDRSGGLFEARGSAVDGAGNVYFAGTAKGSPDQPETFNIRAGKLSAKGELLWVKDFDGGQEDLAAEIALDASGNVHVLGSAHRGGNFRDYLLLKYSPSGTLLWSAVHGSRLIDEARAMRLDHEGNVYVAGSSGTVKFGPNGQEAWSQPDFNGAQLAVENSDGIYVLGHPIVLSQDQSGREVRFNGKAAVRKYDSQGLLIWSKGGFEIADHANLAVDSSEQVFVATTSQAGPKSELISLKLDRLGTKLWQAAFRGLPKNGRDFPASLAVDSQGSLYVTGASLGPEDRGLDTVTIKYDSSGREIWSARYLGPDALDDIPSSMEIGTDGSIYVAGSSFNSTIRSATLFLLKYTELPPTLLASPASTNVLSGGDATFEVKAGGTPPLNYQWRFQGTSIPGAIAPALAVRGVGLKNLGDYDVVISNQHGKVQSAPATLSMSFVLHASASEGGGVETAPTSAGYSTNATVTLTAQARPGFVFTDWTGDATGRANPLRVVMNNDKSIRANFAPTGEPIVEIEGQAAFSFDFTNRASVIVELRTTFPKGTVFFTLDGSPPSLSSPAYLVPLTLTNSAVLRAIAYSTNFTTAAAEPVPVNLWRTHRLTHSTLGGGSFAVNPSGTDFRNDAIVQITALPNPGWSFLHWASDATGSNPEIQISMQSDRQVSAVFGTRPNLEVIGPGEIRLQPDRPLYPFGSEVRALGVPEEGHFFALWGGHANGTANPFTLSVTNGAPTLTALFAELGENEVSLTLFVNGHGRASAFPPQNVFQAGDKVTIQATPDPDERFYFWSGGAAGNTNALDFTIVTSKRITANFSGGHYDLRLSSAFLADSNQLQFTLLGEPNRRARIELSEDFVNWSALGNPTLSPDGRLSFQHPLPMNITTQGFFRAFLE